MPSSQMAIPNSFLLFLLSRFIEILFNDGLHFYIVLGILVGEDYIWEVFMRDEYNLRLVLNAFHCLHSIRHSIAFNVKSELAFLDAEDLTFSKDWYFDILHWRISLNLELPF